MNLDQIRIATRTQLDLDDTDLPDALLDLYIQDGYDRIISLETRWPFFESLWTVVAPADGSVAMPVDAREIDSIMGPSGRLWRIDARHAENMFGVNVSASAVGYSKFWSQLGPTVRLYPSPTSAAVTYQFRGYRKPANWIAQGASSEVDADDRLHLAIIWYACSVGYAQQEDEVLEATYMNRFKESASIAHDDVMRPWSGAPKILNGYSYFQGPNAWVTPAPQLIFQLPSGP